MVPEKKVNLPLAAVDSMLSWQHWREIASNRSPEIDKVNREAGVPVGSFWCEASRYAAFNRSAKKAGVRNPFMRTASVSTQLRHASRIGSGLQVLVMNPALQVKRGDTFSMRRGGRTWGEPNDIGKIWPGHTGLCLADYGEAINTIEGNQNNRVRTMVRPKYTILAIIRIPDSGD